MTATSPIISRNSGDLFKFTGLDGDACNGGTGHAYLPKDGQPGEWMPELTGRLVPCTYGYHVCRVTDLVHWIGPALHTVECRGNLIEVNDSDPKVVVAQYRILETLPVWTERVMRLFACDCAEHALLAQRARGNEPDPRSWESIRVARLFADGLATREQLAAARAAAWAAARAAAWDAARAAAWDAARAAARDAAWGAARDAAWAAERSWQTDRILGYLNGADLAPVTYEAAEVTS